MEALYTPPPCRGFFYLYSKYLSANHTWKFLPFKNFMLPMPIWKKITNLVLLPLRAFWNMGLKIVHAWGSSDNEMLVLNTSAYIYVKKIQIFWDFKIASFWIINSSPRPSLLREQKWISKVEGGGDDDLNAQNIPLVYWIKSLLLPMNQWAQLKIHLDLCMGPHRHNARKGCRKAKPTVVKPTNKKNN